jgi:hypothetical protein
VQPLKVAASSAFRPRHEKLPNQAVGHTSSPASTNRDWGGHIGGGAGGEGGGEGGAGTCFAHVTPPIQLPLPTHIDMRGHVLDGWLYAYVYENRWHTPSQYPKKA